MAGAQANKPSVTKFKGRPILQLPQEGDNGQIYVFSFGVKKAQQILDNIDFIRKFVAEHKKD